MSLLSKKIFVTETAWIALLDAKNKEHDVVKNKFKYLLDGHYRLMTSSYVLDSVIEKMKKNGASEKAADFLDLIDRAILSNSIKVFWLNRRLRRKALRSHLENKNEKLNDTLNIILIQQKKVDTVFTLNQDFYKDFNLSCLELD